MLSEGSLNPENAIIVVSGLPRSGTSMMMGMLEAGGIGIVTDGVRQLDEDNPRGYYELETVKTLGTKARDLWLEPAKGRAIKVISELIRNLPSRFLYKVILMNRNLKEVMVSQNRMLARRGEPFDPEQDAQVEELLERQLGEVRSWLRRNSNFDLLEVDYRLVIEMPIQESERVASFLKADLDPTKMAEVVDEKLYRNRL